MNTNLTVARSVDRCINVQFRTILSIGDKTSPGSHGRLLHLICNVALESVSHDDQAEKHLLALQLNTKTPTSV